MQGILSNPIKDQQLRFLSVHFLASLGTCDCSTSASRSITKKNMVISGKKSCIDSAFNESAVLLEQQQNFQPYEPIPRWNLLTP